MTDVTQHMPKHLVTDGSEVLAENDITLDLRAASVAALAARGAQAGTFTATGATPVTVADPNVTANSAIIITLKTVGGTVGAAPAVKTITPGTGFTVAATAGDDSVYNYAVFG
jgi:hypothetical protein